MQFSWKTYFVAMSVFSCGTEKDMYDLLLALGEEQYSFYEALMHFCRQCGRSSGELPDLYVTPDGPICVSCQDDIDLYDTFLPTEY